jgi:hypothetical protein
VFLKGTMIIAGEDGTVFFKGTTMIIAGEDC